MSVTLSSSDLQKLSRAITILASPLDYPHVDAWRSAVNADLRELLHADSAGFLLPVDEGLMLYSEEHDPASLAKYQDYPPPPFIDGTPMWEKLVAEKVGTIFSMYGKHHDLYLESAYYNEYAGANGAHDTLAAAVGIAGAERPGMASLQLWHAHPDGRRFGERELTLMRLLYPAFRAGVETHLQWSGHRSNLLTVVDELGQAALLSDGLGSDVHQTPALTEMLEADPDGAALRREMLAATDRLHRIARRRRSARARPAKDTPVVVEVRTDAAAYVIRACLYGGPPAAAAPMVLTALERLTPIVLSRAELQARFGLTRAEAGVALLIGRGLSNAEVAAELFISPHTAKRHTERVLFKMGIRSRAEVCPKLLS